MGPGAGGWWTDATPEMVEVARRRLRGLMSLIEPGKQVVVTTNVADVMGANREEELLDLGGASSLAQFRRKARAYVDAHADHVTLVRLRQGRPLTPTDLDELQNLFLDAGLAGTEDFDRIRKMPDLPDFNRLFVNGVLWVLRSGAHWPDLAESSGVTTAGARTLRGRPRDFCAGSQSQRLHPDIPLRLSW